MGLLDVFKKQSTKVTVIGEVVWYTLPFDLVI